MEQVDFAISYAGEDVAVAEAIVTGLRERNYSVFFAKWSSAALVGTRMDTVFEEVFTHAKQVIVLISEAYKRKDWTQHEWNVIRKRDFIPVRLDDAQIVGLPNTIGYLSYSGGVGHIVDACVKKLLEYEQNTGIHRPSEYERALNAITNESNGAFAKTHQLIKDKRKRDPLGDVDLPPCENPAYQVVEQRWSGPRVVKKVSVNVVLPRGLPQELVIANLKHCAAVLFNANKPNAILVRGYFQGDDTTGCFTAGRVVFAPFRDWNKAQDGYAYNLPVSEFQYDVTLEPDPVAKAIEDFGGNPDGECGR